GAPRTAALVQRLAGKLLDLDHEIKDIDKTITERFRDHPYAHIIESLPGFGPGLGAEFVVVTRRPGLLRHRGPAGVLRRIGPCTKRFRPHQWQSAPAETLQPPAAARVLHGRAVQHPRRRTVQAVL